MEESSFWLIYIQENSVSVSLAASSEEKFKVVSIGPSKNWDGVNEEQLIASVDESLSIASLNANIDESKEPSTAAFVVPPFWVGNDGKILPPKLKHIKEICKKLSFTPTGFLAEDEALVEDSNKSDGFPSSFILIHLSQNEFYLSLIYLGHIKERIRKPFFNEFNGQLLESTLLEIKTESTLPPQIILFGQIKDDVVPSLKSYPWIGKKNIETFLHLPDISQYSDNDLITIFIRVISSQMSQNSAKASSDLNEDQTVIEPETSDEILETVVDKKVPPITTELELIESSPEDLGFLATPQIPEPNLDNFNPPVIPVPNPTPTITQEQFKKKKISLNFFKKIKFPKFNINFNIFWIILIILPFFAVIPFIFASADITLFVNPYKFDKTVTVTLKTDASESDIASSIIPIQKETFDVDVSAVVETTGHKTIGEKAKGEITIYNKIDKVQNIPKGSILTDSSGKKFELTSAVSVDSSSSSFNDQNNLITVSGQTRTVAIASDIGPEFNLSSNSQLSFKDYPSTSIIAKAETSFSGGSKQEIKAVSQADKTSVQSKIEEAITKAVEDKINQTLGNVSGVIKETIQSNKGPLNLSREIGEVADELTGTVTASVSVFTLSSTTKESIIKQFLSNEPNFNEINFDPNSYSLNFKVSNISSTQATASLNITGQSLPKIDITTLQKALSIKTIKQAENTIKKLILRAYSFNIRNKLPLLPFNPKNINIEVKTENL